MRTGSMYHRIAESGYLGTRPISSTGVIALHRVLPPPGKSLVKFKFAELPRNSESGWIRDVFGYVAYTDLGKTWHRLQYKPAPRYSNTDSRGSMSFVVFALVAPAVSPLLATTTSPLSILMSSTTWRAAPLS